MGASLSDLFNDAPGNLRGKVIRVYCILLAFNLERGFGRESHSIITLCFSAQPCLLTASVLGMPLMRITSPRSTM